MSRAQWIRGFFASQTCIPRITGKMLPNLGMHGLRAEEVRRYGKPPGMALSAIGHQL
jgi:hypothetical protein